LRQRWKKWRTPPPESDQCRGKPALAAEFEHSEEGFFGLGAEVFGHGDLGGQVQQGVVEFLEGVHLHVAAVGAGAVAGEFWLLSMATHGPAEGRWSFMGCAFAIQSENGSHDSA
jgi:hypothetical protein